MSGYRNAPITLELDEALRRRVDRVVEYTDGTVDRQRVIVAALELALPELEARAAVFAARHVSRCPRCGGATRHSEVAELRLTQCSECGGFWLDAASARQLVAASIAAPKIGELAARAAESATKRVDLNEKLVCPVCRGELARRRFLLVSFVVDVCDGHGTFFDRGELPKLLAALARQAFQRLELGDQALADEIDDFRRSLVSGRALAPSWP